MRLESHIPWNFMFRMFNVQRWSLNSQKTVCARAMLVCFWVSPCEYFCFCSVKMCRSNLSYSYFAMCRAHASHLRFGEHWIPTAAGGRLSALTHVFTPHLLIPTVLRYPGCMIWSNSWKFRPQRFWEKCKNILIFATWKKRDRHVGGAWPCQGAYTLKVHPNLTTFFSFSKLLVVVLGLVCVEELVSVGNVPQLTSLAAIFR